MSVEIVYFVAVVCMVSITAMALQVGYALLRGDIEVRLIPTEEITALYRLIHSLPGYARLRSPDEIRQADIDSQAVAEEAQQKVSPTVRGAEDVA